MPICSTAGKLTAQQQSQLSTLRGSADTLLFLLNDILDFSRIEAGGLQLEALPFNFRDVIGQVTHAFTPAARKKGLELWFDIDPSLPDLIIGDKFRLAPDHHQPGSNNAVKFTASGGIRISCLPVKASNGQDHLKIVVRDTGIGIDDEALRDIFVALPPGRRQHEPALWRQRPGVGHRP